MCIRDRNGRLSFTLPPEASPSGGSTAFDEYVSDPAKPVPFVPQIVNRMTREYMTMDQRHASMRPDVLTYVSDVLEDDLVLAGTLSPKLFF